MWGLGWAQSPARGRSGPCQCCAPLGHQTCHPPRLSFPLGSRCSVDFPRFLAELVSALGCFCQLNHLSSALFIMLLSVGPTVPSCPLRVNHNLQSVCDGGGASGPLVQSGHPWAPLSQTTWACWGMGAEPVYITMGIYPVIRRSSCARRVLEEERRRPMLWTLQRRAGCPCSLVHLSRPNLRAGFFFWLPVSPGMVASPYINTGLTPTTTGLLTTLA